MEFAVVLPELGKTTAQAGSPVSFSIQDFPPNPRPVTGVATSEAFE